MTTRDSPQWQVTLEPGAAPVPARLQPDPQLQAVEGTAGLEWKSAGERACFRLAGDGLPRVLPAGWYQLDGMIRASDGAAMMPCLYPVYAAGADGDAQIVLPEPDGGGRLRVLVLFKYDVATLRFSPGYCGASFELGEFSLERVSRGRALRRMLGDESDAGSRPAVIGRGLSFAGDALRRGLSEATVRSFANYQRRVQPQAADDYQSWVQRFDTLTEARIADLQQRAARCVEHGPTISVLLPVYQTPERWLRRCIDSLLAQAYPNWQLCIADDASPDARVLQVLQEYARADSRIQVVQRADNGHISAASNSALELASGEYVALLDHDDELRPHALLEMAEAVIADPGRQLVYSDEDKIDVDGRRFDPYFKPDFDPDLLRSQNYICHFTMLDADLVRSVGGFREGFEGSQDHDLILRCAERLPAAAVAHIPKVLYHWRAIPGSTALTRDAKDYASSAGVRAVAEHLQRCHAGARAQELSHGHYRVRWPLPEPAPKVSLIVPTRDRASLLRMCVESLLEKTDYPDFEVVVVDNQSSEPDALAYLAQLQDRPRVRVLRYDAPFNYSAINNWAAGQCDGQVLGLVNNDIEVISPDWLDEMAAQAIRADVGAVGAMLYYPDDTIQHAGVILGVHGVAAHAYAGMGRGYPGHGGRARVTQSLSAVTGACLLVRRELYAQLGGLDESLQVAFNDIDFCLRLRAAGYRNIWTPFAELYHHESASRGSEDTDEKKRRFEGEVEFMLQRWGEQLRADPAYNPNLSLTSRHFELSVPPRG